MELYLSSAVVRGVHEMLNKAFFRAYEPLVSLNKALEWGTLGGVDHPS